VGSPYVLTNWYVPTLKAEQLQILKAAAVYFSPYPDKNHFNHTHNAILLSETVTVEQITVSGKLVEPCATTLH
jgi:hypothetical protein